jgi:tetratricopeptide (TPR) repeat protein
MSKRPPPDPMLSEVQQEFNAISALLVQDDPVSRDEAKQRIINLFRKVDAALADFSRLKENIRGLVDRYHQLGPKVISNGPDPAPLVRDDLGASTFVEKGWSLIALGDSAGAMQALQRALELSPGNSQALTLLGWAEMLGERLDDALNTFSQVLTRDPDNALARVNVGYICLKKRIFGEAIEHLSRVIRLENDPRATLYAHYYLGLVYLERGMYTDSRAFLEKAINLGPNLIEAYYDLGRAQWLAGQREQAKDTWRKGASANRFAPWAARCEEILERAVKGGEVPRSLFS